MKTITALEITPTERAAVTPCELLEDFADATPSWHFLEDDSTYYAALKGCPACVLRHARLSPFATTDFAFVATGESNPSTVRLVLIERSAVDGSDVAEARRDAVAHFKQTFQQYLEARGLHAEIRAVEAEMSTP